MCTIRLSYDQTNAKARDMLATMIDSGLFHVSEAADEDLDIDYSDPWLYEDHGDLPPLPEGKETFTPEEVRTMLMEDLREITLIHSITNRQDEEIRSSFEDKI